MLCSFFQTLLLGNSAIIYGNDWKSLGTFAYHPPLQALAVSAFAYGGSRFHSIIHCDANQYSCAFCRNFDTPTYVATSHEGRRTRPPSGSHYVIGHTSFGLRDSFDCVQEVAILFSRLYSELARSKHSSMIRFGCQKRSN